MRKSSGNIGYFDWDAIEPTTGQKGKFRLTKPGGYQENPQYSNFEPRWARRAK